VMPCPVRRNFPRDGTQMHPGHAAHCRVWRPLSVNAIRCSGGFMNGTDACGGLATLDVGTKLLSGY
jgi:hypothetical protein